MSDISTYDDLLSLARRRGMTIEGRDILFSEVQGDNLEALVCLDRWLVWRDDSIRIQVRMIGRDSPSDDWQTLCETETLSNYPVSVEQGRQLLEHWWMLDLESTRRSQVRDIAERERLEVFGPRSGLVPR